MTDLARALLDDLDPGTLDRLAEALWPGLAARLDARPVEAPERLLSCAEAAQRAGVCDETIRRAVRRGKLPAGRAGRSLRIDPADLAAWLTVGERPPKPPVPRSRARHPRAGRPLGDALASLDTQRSEMISSDIIAVR